MLSVNRIYIILLCTHSQVELVNDNLFEWNVRVFDVDPDSELAHDMQELDVQCILLHLIFPENFPFLPPFMRVVEPKIEKGFVMNGNYIVFYLLFLSAIVF